MTTKKDPPNNEGSGPAHMSGNSYSSIIPQAPPIQVGEGGASATSKKAKQPVVSKSLTSYEAWDYARLKALEVRGYKEQEELRKAPKMTAEAIVAFINQLSPWNLKTTGVSILQAYVQQQGGVTDLAKQGSESEAPFVIQDGKKIVLDLKAGGTGIDLVTTDRKPK